MKRGVSDSQELLSPPSLRGQDHLIATSFKDLEKEAQSAALLQRRREARRLKEEAVKERELKVNPLLEKVLWEFYGVKTEKSDPPPKKAVAKRKKWDQEKGRWKEGVERIMLWKGEREEKVERLRGQVEEEVLEECTFNPSITNKSRKIMSEKGDEIRTRLGEKKEADYMNPKEDGSIPPQKSIKKMKPEEAKTFYKRMTDWKDTRDKVVQNKMIKKLHDEQEKENNTIDIHIPKIRRKSRKKHIEYIHKLNSTKNGWEEKMRGIQEDQLKGYFKPKTTKFIPKVITNEIERYKLDRFFKNIDDPEYQEMKRSIIEERRDELLSRSPVGEAMWNRLSDSKSPKKNILRLSPEKTRQSKENINIVYVDLEVQEDLEEEKIFAKADDFVVNAYHGQ